MGSLIHRPSQDRGLALGDPVFRQRIESFDAHDLKTSGCCVCRDTAKLELQSPGAVEVLACGTGLIREFKRSRSLIIIYEAFKNPWYALRR